MFITCTVQLSKFDQVNQPEMTGGALIGCGTFVLSRSAESTTGSEPVLTQFLRRTRASTSTVWPARKRMVLQSGEPISLEFGTVLQIDSRKKHNSPPSPCSHGWRGSTILLYSTGVSAVSARLSSSDSASKKQRNYTETWKYYHIILEQFSNHWGHDPLHTS